MIIRGNGRVCSHLRCLHASISDAARPVGYARGVNVAAAPTVAIVTVTYNAAGFLAPFLTSLERLCYQRRRLIVVDCASRDGTAALVERLAPRATLLRLSQNRGITGGNNAGIRWALMSGCDYVLFLNPDTTVDAHLLDALVRAGGPRRLLTAPVYLAGGQLMDDTAGEFDWRRGIWRDSLYGRPRPRRFARQHEVAMASLTCLLVPAQALLELGGSNGPWMDERYFMYYDDFDFVRRLQALGYRAVYTPEAAVQHRKSAAGGGVDSPFKHYYATRNRVLLMRELLGPGAFASFLLYFAGGRVVRMAAAAARRRPRVALAILRGYVHALAGRYGRSVLPDR